MTNKIYIYIIICILAIIPSGCAISNYLTNSYIHPTNSINEAQTITELLTITLFPPFSPKIIAKDINVQEMKLDNNNIFLIAKMNNKQGNNSIEDSRIERVPKTGGKIVTLSEEDSVYKNLFLDDNYVYWISNNNSNQSHPIESLNRINKNGGKVNVLYQVDGYLIFPEIQDINYLILFSYPTNDPSEINLIQINKKDNSLIIVSEGKEDIRQIVVHNGYIYWTACMLDNTEKKLTGIIKRNRIGEIKIDIIISDDCYDLPIVNDKGIYWLGQYIIFIDDESKLITKIINRSILEGDNEVSNTKNIEGEKGISDILSIDGKDIYFSIAQSMVSGFSSCTDESEAIWKYSFSNEALTEIISFSGRAVYYQYNNLVYIFTDCNVSHSMSLNLNNDKILTVNIGGIKLFAIDDNKIYWIDADYYLKTQPIGDE